MEVSFRCPLCAAANAIQVSAVSSEDFRCGSCAGHVELDLSDSIQRIDIVDRCPLCGFKDFYVQKDFNQRLGLGIVILSALVGLAFVLLDRPLGFYLSLLAAAVLDALLYLILPKVTICYRCKSEFRSFRPNPAHRAFDLKLADVYDMKGKK